jgi:enoyl-CoA hydratase/carnithine racemase
MVNEVVPDDQVEARALELAKAIAANSPDSVVAGLYGKCVLNLPNAQSAIDAELTRTGIRLTGECASTRQANAMFVDSAQYRAVNTGSNIKEGLLAFQERREPRWVPSKL